MEHNLPHILRKIRLDHGFSQENIAEELKVNATTYGRYEKGESEIGFEQVVRLANFYKLTLDEVYNYGNPKISEVNESRMQYKTPEKITVIVELDGLPTTLEKWVTRLTAINQVI